MTIRGDEVVEGDETLMLTLSAPTGGASIAVGSATGTIPNDDGVEIGGRLYLPMVRR